MRSSARERRNTLLVLGFALAGRVATVWYAAVHFGPCWFFSRGQEMGLLGDALLHGQGLSSPFGTATGPLGTGPTAILAPGYPLLVALVFWLAGSYSQASSLLLMGVNVGLNVLTVWLVLRLARRLTEERAAVAAAVFWACSLPLLWMPTICWETSFSCCLLLGGAMLAMRLACPGKPGWIWAAAGALCALAGVLNPALLPSLFAMGAAAACCAGRASWRQAALAALVFTLSFAPWPIRNARLFGAFIPTRTTVGLEVWMGNHAGADGFLDESRFPAFNAEELADYRRQGEVGYTDRKGREARTWIAAHPAEFARLSLLRVLRFWTGTGSRDGSAFFALHALLTTLLGMLGLWRLLRRRLAMAWIALLPLLVFPLPYYITHAEFRYRLVLDPLLTALAAAAWGSSGSSPPRAD